MSLLSIQASGQKKLVSSELVPYGARVITYEFVTESEGIHTKSWVVYITRMSELYAASAVQFKRASVHS